MQYGHTVCLFVPSHNAHSWQWLYFLTPPYFTNASNILMQAQEVLNAVVFVVVATAVHVSIVFLSPASIGDSAATALCRASPCCFYYLCEINQCSISSWKPPTAWWISIETWQARRNFVHSTERVIVALMKTDRAEMWCWWIESDKWMTPVVCPRPQFSALRTFSWDTFCVKSFRVHNSNTKSCL
jgi:hypothetical protein